MVKYDQCFKTNTDKKAIREQLWKSSQLDGITGNSSEKVAFKMHPEDTTTYGRSQDNSRNRAGKEKNKQADFFIHL